MAVSPDCNPTASRLNELLWAASWIFFPAKLLNTHWQQVGLDSYKGQAELSTYPNFSSQGADRAGKTKCNALRRNDRRARKLSLQFNLDMWGLPKTRDPNIVP